MQKNLECYTLRWHSESNLLICYASITKEYIMNNPLLVSIVIPCRNEEKFIAKCLDSIIANDYPKDRLEILIVDGMSEDETRDIVEGYTQQYRFIKLLDNPKKITPVAFNIGVQHAKGEIIMIMSAHSTYEENYISKCVKFLGEYNADNVGGILITVPGDDTLIAKSIVLSLSNPFGVGNSHFRIGGVKEPKWSDTAAFGCYKREVFERIGLYNENLARSSDMDFNVRLKNAGGKILLVPDIVAYYHARPNFKAFCKHNLSNGFWATYPLKFVNMSFSLRHYIPFIFVSSLIGSAVLSVFSPIFLWLFLFIFGSYALANAYFSVKIAAKEKDFRYLFAMPLIFATLHISYSLGSLWGLLKVIMSVQFWKNRFGWFFSKIFKYGRQV